MSGFKTVLANQISATVEAYNCQILAEFAEERIETPDGETHYIQPNVIIDGYRQNLSKCIDGLRQRGYTVSGVTVTFR